MNRILFRKFGAGISLSLLLVTGCDRSHDHADHDQDHHDHEFNPPVSFAWSDRFEVFMEYQVPVAGEPTVLIPHITDLRSAEPHTGPIKFRSHQGSDTPIEHTAQQPTSPGIYELQATFPKPGDWQPVLAIPTAEGEATVNLPAIKVFATADEAAHAEHDHPPEGIRFLKQQQWKLHTRMATISRHRLVERVQVPAQVRAKPGFSASIAAPLAGQIALAGKSFPQPGTRVEAGDVLALLQPRFSESAARFIEIEAEFGRSTAELKQASINYERTKQLASQQAKSQRELQEAETALASARARHSAASALRATYAKDNESGTNAIGPALELRAPLAGVVTSVSAGVGEPVSVDQVLFTVLNPEMIWLEARVPEAAMARLETARDALCEVLDGSERMFPVLSESGRLVFTGLEVDPATKTVPLIYELNNASARLRVGQSVRLHVETARAEETLAIPESALIEEGGLFVAFVQVSGETFQRRELKLGIRDGKLVQVLEGLEPGERVVTKGAYAIRLAAASNAIPEHGHTH